FLTHMLINPQVDRSKTSAQREAPFLHLGRVRETPAGIWGGGARVPATMAPITEEVAVIPFGGVPPGDDAYALAFGIPTNATGLKFICRETVAPLPRSRFDHPLSSRFEEMDCIAIFEDVLVPWDRVMVDGSPGSAEVINSMGADYGALLNVQTSARMLSQLEFFCGLGMKVADAIGITGFLHVQEKLGEMLSQMEIARAVFYGAEAMAQRLANGVWVPGGHGLRAFHLQTGKVYSRFVEIIQTLAAGGFFYAPSEADLESPELRPMIDRYVRGRAGVSAEERIALFKLAWDATGETFAQRMAQYVRFYSGDPLRLTAGFYTQYDKGPLLELIERARGHREGAPLPITPDDPGAPIPYQPGTRGMAGTYAATSLPSSPRPS